MKFKSASVITVFSKADAKPRIPKAPKISDFAFIKVREKNNSKGKFGKGNQVFELRKMNYEALVIICSESLCIKILYYKNITEKKVPPEIEKEIKGKNCEEKADRFLKRNFDIRYPNK